MSIVTNVTTIITLCKTIVFYGFILKRLVVKRIVSETFR